MKMTWEDIYDVFDGASLWENGHDMYWYRLMWGLMEYKHMNEYETTEEKVKVYSRAFSIIRIYMEFIGLCFEDDDDDFVEAISDYSSDVFEYLYDEDDIKEIFSILNKELGTRRTFYSMFITCIEFRRGSAYFFDDEDDESYEECEYNEYDENFDDDYDEDEEYEEDDEYYYDEYEEDDEEDDEEIEYSEDYYTSFNEYLKVLATSSMSLLRNITPEKAAAYLYLAGNMRNEKQ
ncbi:MAG: hypothetical protein IJP18_03065 [Oscillospiraceae bacterium]|nr:hypothetical protein [Oscillospiraceae bacterium]